MIPFLSKPDTKNPIKLHAATSSAYGICVETWSICLQSAPADESIVVSEIGEIWSPHTAPDRIEATQISSIFPFPNTAIAIGMSMPNVPHDVPVAKASPTEIKKNNIGYNPPTADSVFTTLLTKPPILR